MRFESTTSAQAFVVTSARSEVPATFPKKTNVGRSRGEPSSAGALERDPNPKRPNKLRELGGDVLAGGDPTPDAASPTGDVALGATSIGEPAPSSPSAIGESGVAATFAGGSPGSFMGGTPYDSRRRRATKTPKGPLQFPFNPKIWRAKT